MEIKIKVTYFDMFGYQQIAAKIFIIYGWIDLTNQLSVNGIPEQGIIGIEVVLDADEQNIIDTTK